MRPGRRRISLSAGLSVARSRSPRPRTHAPRGHGGSPSIAARLLDHERPATARRQRSRSGARPRPFWRRGVEGAMSLRGPSFAARPHPWAGGSAARGAAGRQGPESSTYSPRSTNPRRLIKRGRPRGRCMSRENRGPRAGLAEAHSTGPQHPVRAPPDALVGRRLGHHGGPTGARSSRLPGKCDGRAGNAAHGALPVRRRPTEQPRPAPQDAEGKGGQWSEPPAGRSRRGRPTAPTAGNASSSEGAAHGNSGKLVDRPPARGDCIRPRANGCV